MYLLWHYIDFQFQPDCSAMRGTVCVSEGHTARLQCTTQSMLVLNGTLIHTQIYAYVHTHTQILFIDKYMKTYSVKGKLAKDILYLTVYHILAINVS